MQYPYENLENFTLPSLLKRSLSLYASNDAFSKVGHKPMKYNEFGKKVESMTQLLTQNGIKQGDKVALLGENMPNWSIAYFAITSLGAVVVPILPDFNPADVHHIIRHSESKAIFVSEKLLEIVEEIEESQINFAILLDNLEIIDEKIKQNFHTPKELSKPNEDDLAAILYTSGTTGHSKGVMLTHKNLVTNALSAYKNIQIKSDDVFLSILPLAHTFECTVGMLIPVLHGASVVYIDKAPTPNILLKAFAVVRPTMMLSVPLVIEKIYKNKIQSKFQENKLIRLFYTKFPFVRKRLNKIAGKKLIETFGGRLRFYGIGGAPLACYVEEFLYEADFPYIIGYGLTETAPLIAGTRMGMPRKLGSAGLTMPGVEIKIKKEYKEQSEGEIAVKSPSVMFGYYKDKQKTKEVFDEDGYFLTGDLGYIDEDGYLFISGRSKNMILGPSGENIYPEQIENIINQDAMVLDALVLQKEGKLVAKIHLDYEQINATTTAENIQELLEQMRQKVNEKMASFSKITKFIEQKEPFIKTPTKKIKRYLYEE
ncbi:MAG: AMP-binding protein [Epsilonproteobacteria bacterium]|nr:AMP-binding protein [Campylobacterota bacterium]